MNMPVEHANPAPQKRQSLVTKVASKYGVDPDKFLATLTATCFQLRDRSQKPTNEQLVSLLVVADQYGLNPFTKEIFAFEDKNKGVVPIVSVDGWSRMINDHPQMDGIEFRFSDNIVNPAKGKPCPEWCEAIIYRKDRGRPIIVREYLDECYVAPRNGYDGPWQTHTKRMLRHKAEIQCARIAFSFSGIYDEDEGHRVIEGVATRVTDVTKVGSLQGRLESAAAAAGTGVIEGELAEPQQHNDEPGQEGDGAAASTDHDETPEN